MARHCYYKLIYMFVFFKRPYTFLIAGLLNSVLTKRGMEGATIVKSMTLAGPFCAINNQHCSTNGTLGCKLKTPQPTDKEYGLRPSLHPGLMLRQE